MESAPSVKPDRDERQGNWLSAGDVRFDADLLAHIPPHNVIIDDGEGMWWSAWPLLRLQERTASVLTTPHIGG